MLQNYVELDNLSSGLSDNLSDELSHKQLNCAIPKIIHQTFSSSCLPPLFKQCQTAIKKIYAEYTYKFYSDNDIETFMIQFFPDFKRNVFDKLPAKIMKIDVFRYCLMHKYGGVYSDLDYQTLRKFNFDSYSLVLPISHTTTMTPNTPDTDFVLGNCFFASAPKHPFWLKLLNELTNNINDIVNNFPKKKELSKYKKYVLNTTGPNFLTHVYKSYFINDSSIFLPPKHYFHPNRYLNKTMDRDDNYGFHNCSGSWIK